MRRLALVVCLLALASPTAAQSGRSGQIGFAVRDGRIVRDAPRPQTSEDQEADERLDETGDDADPAGEIGTDARAALPRPTARFSRPAPTPVVERRSRAAPTRLTTGDPRLDHYIRDSSARHGVDPRLVLAVMRQESGFHSRARSPKGASGYMQLMPATARRFGVTDIFDPQQNIDAGVRYLRLLLEMFDGRVELALAGYNAGEYRVIRSGYRIPEIRETQNYVRAITAHYRSLLGVR